MIKIIFTDADGTLLNTSGNISNENLKICLRAQQQNIPVVITTGRYGVNALELAKQIKAPTYNGYVIGSDGAEIWSFKDNKWIYLSQINLNITRKLAEWLLDYDNKLLLNFISLNNMYVNSLYPKWGSFYKWLKNLIIPINKIEKSEEIREDISRIIVILEKGWKKEKTDKFFAEFEEKFPNLTIVQSNDNIYSISKKNINKGTAISWLCKYLNINFKDILGIGDNFNDIPMFEVVGYPVVMHNAHQSIKDYGILIAPSNDNNGFYHGIKHILDRVVKS